MPTTFQPQLDPLGSVALRRRRAPPAADESSSPLGLLRWSSAQGGSLTIARRDPRRGPGGQDARRTPASAATQGAVFGALPIIWIVFTAIALLPGHRRPAAGSEDLRAYFNLSAVTARQAMLSSRPASAASARAALAVRRSGHHRRHAHGCWLLGPACRLDRPAFANTAPVAFGAIAILIIGRQPHQDPYTDIGVCRSTRPAARALRPALPRPARRRSPRLQQCWPVALVTGVSFGIVSSSRRTTSPSSSPISSPPLVGLGAVVLLRFWQPPEPPRRMPIHADRTLSARR